MNILMPNQLQYNISIILLLRVGMVVLYNNYHTGFEVGCQIGVFMLRATDLPMRTGSRLHSNF